jgi:hypothetical protein
MQCANGKDGLTSAETAHTDYRLEWKNTKEVETTPVSTPPPPPQVDHVTWKDHGKPEKKKNTKVRKDSLNLRNISGRASGEPLDWKWMSKMQQTREEQTVLLVLLIGQF